MKNLIIEVSEPARLRSQNGLLFINERSVPFENVATVIASHSQITFSQDVLVALAGAGGILISCDKTYKPASMLLPLVGNYMQTKKFQNQTKLSQFVKDEIWARIIERKIANQYDALRKHKNIIISLPQVSLGDSSGAEAAAAKKYWPALFEYAFRRHSDDKINHCLDFGYAVVRGAFCRSICASGFHPSLGVHHKNLFNPFCLADDLMEPFRPTVDSIVFEIQNEQPVFNKHLKKRLIENLLDKIKIGKESRGLFDWSLIVAQRFDGCVTRGEPFVYV